MRDRGYVDGRAVPGGSRHCHLFGEYAIAMAVVAHTARATILRCSSPIRTRGTNEGNAVVLSSSSSLRARPCLEVTCNTNSIHQPGAVAMYAFPISLHIPPVVTVTLLEPRGRWIVFRVDQVLASSARTSSLPPLIHRAHHVHYYSCRHRFIPRCHGRSPLSVGPCVTDGSAHS